MRMWARARLQVRLAACEISKGGGRGLLLESIQLLLLPLHYPLYMFSFSSSSNFRDWDLMSREEELEDGAFEMRP